MKTSSTKEERLEPKTIHDVSDEVLSNILRRVKRRKHVSLVCRKWYGVDRSVTRELLVGGTRLVPPKQALAALSSRYFNLAKLEILYSTWGEMREQVDDECLRCLSVQCVNLTDLTLEHCNLVTDVGVASIALCPGLIAVRLRIRCVTGRGLLSLVSGCHSLRLLHIQDLNLVRDLEWLEFIGTHAQIESLAIRNCKEVFETELNKLGRRGWRNLREFYFAFTGMLSTEELRPGYVRDQPLPAWKFDDEEGIAFCPNLEVLSLADCVSMPGTGLLWILSQCKTLRKVEIRGCRGLRVYDVRLFTKNNRQISSITWDSARNSNLENAIVVNIAKNCRRLKTLELGYDSCEYPSGLEESMVVLLKRCTRLKSLSLTDFPLDETIMAAIGRSTSLKALAFCNCEDLDELLPLIGSNVTRMSFISCPDITNESLKRFVSSHGVLAHLTVMDGALEITKKGASRACRRLEWIT